MILTEAQIANELKESYTYVLHLLETKQITKHRDDVLKYKIRKELRKEKLKNEN